MYEKLGVLAIRALAIFETTIHKSNGHALVQEAADGAVVIRGVGGHFCPL